MKYTVVFLFSLLIFNCQSSGDKDFKINISSSDKIISNGDKIKIVIESKSGKVIENMQIDSNLISGYKFIDNNFVNFIATLASPFLMYIFIYFAT